jgi:hypothetical protein
LSPAWRRHCCRRCIGGKLTFPGHFRCAAFDAPLSMACVIFRRVHGPWLAGSGVLGFDPLSYGALAVNDDDRPATIHLGTSR